MELMAGGLRIYYTTTGQDPRMFGGGLHSDAYLYENPLTTVNTDGGRVLCRIMENEEWGPLREIILNESDKENETTYPSESRQP